MTSEKTIKVSMEIPKKVAETVTWLSSLVGRNRASVVVEAIQVYKIMWEAKIEGGRLLVEDKNGKMKEIVMKRDE